MTSVSPLLHHLHPRTRRGGNHCPPLPSWARAWVLPNCSVLGSVTRTLLAPGSPRGLSSPADFDLVGRRGAVDPALDSTPGCPRLGGWVLRWGSFRSSDPLSRSVTSASPLGSDVLSLSFSISRGVKVSRSLTFLPNEHFLSPTPSLPKGNKMSGLPGSLATGVKIRTVLSCLLFTRWVWGFLGSSPRR